MTTFTLPNGARFLTFDGDLLGQADSRTAPSSTNYDRTRWFECAVYRTEEGNYVFHTTGRSTRAGEQDRTRAVHCLTAEALIEAAKVDRNGILFIPHTTKHALSQAAELDEDLSDAYYTERVS